MLGTGLKNGILFVLIILILHFLVKNALIEKKMEHLSELQPVLKSKSDEVSVQKEPKLPPVVDQCGKKLPKSEEDMKNELLSYVMEDGDKPSGLPEPNENLNHYNIACDARTIIKEESPFPVAKNAKNPDRQAGNYLTIHEYSNESTLNGGKLFGNLEGYDEFGSFYEEYKCGTK
jgi:hypothetical protein